MHEEQENAAIELEFAKNEAEGSSCFEFVNCSFEENCSPAKLQDNFLSAFPPIDGLLSPQDSAVSIGLSVGSLIKLPSGKLDESSFSPIKPSNLSLEYKLVMDGAACSPCVVKRTSRLASPARVPLSPLRMPLSYGPLYRIRP